MEGNWKDHNFYFLPGNTWAEGIFFPALKQLLSTDYSHPLLMPCCSTRQKCCPEFPPSVQRVQKRLLQISCVSALSSWKENECIVHIKFTLAYSEIKIESMSCIHHDINWNKICSMVWQYKVCVIHGKMKCTQNSISMTFILQINLLTCNGSLHHDFQWLHKFQHQVVLQTFV